MLMTLNRDHVHVSKIGTSIEFKADKPTHVPPKLVPEIIGLGGQVAEKDQAAVDAEMKVVKELELAAAGRAPAIEAAIRKLVERNKRGDFTAGGTPNLNVLSKVSGLEVTQEELDPIWRAVKETLQ